ncbi:MAG: hypothetical protein HC802_23230 [Caldilineaceae bacterium]|nr:hypothetical protein [Caldilineaceae bacterium]
MRNSHPFRFGTACKANTRHELIEQARRAEELGYSTLLLEDHLSRTLSSPTVLFGTVDGMADQLVEQRERYGFSYVTIMHSIAEFAPVVARLAGT